MSTAHTKQVTPTDGNEAPLVGTGAEFIVPQISSTRFVQKSKKDGIITEVDQDKTMTIKYNDGTTENLDILPRLSRTKMGCYISLPMIPLEVNTKVKKNQIVAHTKNFDHNGVYASGRNVFMAMMNYRGLSHEDAYVVNESLANIMQRDIIKEVSVVVPPDTKILYLEKEIGKNVTSKDVLVEFSYKEDLDKYLDLNQLDDLGDNEILSTYVQGQESIKLLAKDGEITDIKVYINNKNTADRQLLTLHSKMVTDTKKIIGKLSQNISDKDSKLKVVDNMNLNFMKVGDHKIKGNEFQGVKVSYFIRQKQALTHGDKISTRFGAKGVISKVIPMDQDPYSEVTKKPIEVFISPLGVFSRKNICMVKELYLGKVIYFLNEKIHQMADNPKVNLDKIIKLVKSIYSLLGCKEVEESVNKTIDGMSPTALRKMFKDPLFTFRFTVPPFSSTSFESIKSAADILGIPLDEKVYVPELKCWTKDPVPVGVTYIQALEQTAEIYSNIRSAGKYQSLTGQATKGKTREGGQSLGNLDVYALLTYDAPDVLKELMTLRSDDHRSKRQVINSIISTGQANIPISTGGGATSMLLDVYMTGLGLETTD